MIQKISLYLCFVLFLCFFKTSSSQLADGTLAVDVLNVQERLAPKPEPACCCTVNNGGCGPFATCSQDMTTGKVTCTCKQGCRNVGKNGKVDCKAYCDINNGGCGPHATCSYNITTDTILCDCKPGAKNVGKNGTVECKALCAIDNGGCGINENCLFDPNKNSIRCECKPGYKNVGKGDKLDCKVWCEIDNGGCGRYATCWYFEMKNIIICECKPGYTDVGKNGSVDCRDSCTVNNGGCGLHTNCSHDPKTYDVACACAPGYVNAGKGGMLLCKDSCAVNNGGCPNGSICSHEPKTRAVVCTCRSGYNTVRLGDKISCEPRLSTASTRKRKPSRPVDFNGTRDHKIIKTDEKFIYGIVVIYPCRYTLYANKTRRCLILCTQIQSMLHDKLNKAGIKEIYGVYFVSVTGTREKTNFQYKVPCKIARQDVVKTQLINVWNEKIWIDILTNDKKPNPNESSSQIDPK